MNVHLGTRLIVLWMCLVPLSGSAVDRAGPQAPAPSASPSSAPTLRLPGDVRPTRQAIDLTINPREEKFSGVVDIDVTMRSAAPVIWLNAMSLSVHDATLTTAGRSRRLHVVPGNEHVIGFSAEDGTIGPGAGRLHIVYEGVISRRDVEGLFAQQEGDTWYAFTQFEPIGARRAFPCFDEPGYKIPWQVTLHLPAGEQGFSNTQETSKTTDASGMTTVVFAQTRPLPSYLVALAVGPFDIVEAGKAGRNETPVRILVPRGHAADARWAVQTTPKILTMLEDYFDSAYPYEKLDQVSVPNFPGAMENPGLVTYGQTIILQKPDEETIPARRSYVSIAAHELAHQWFGDLVTPAWWDDIWLNESFASWLGQRVTGRFGPDWSIDVEKVRSRSAALKADSLTTARSVRQPIESLHDIANAFDGITYEKGEAVLEMFESWLGDDVFRRGVRQYIHDHEWGNATVGDFTAALSSAAGRDVATPFSSFLNQPGAPLVSIELTCDGTQASLALRQQKYLPLGSAGGAQSASWQIPVCVRYDGGDSGTRQCTLMTTGIAELALKPARHCPRWVLGNDRYAGYYRVRHGRDLLTRLLQENVAQLTEAERVGLLTDTSALIASGDVLAGQALEITTRSAADRSRHIVDATMSIVEGVRRFVPDEQRSAYAALVRRLYGERARALGWRSKPGEDDDDRLLRASLVKITGTLGEDRTLSAEAVKLANRWLEDASAVDPDMVDVVLAVAARSGDRALFDRLHKEAGSSTDRERRERVLRGLGNFRAPEIVPLVLAITLEPEIDPRESFYVVFAVGSDPSSRDLAYAFVRDHYDDLVARLPQGSVFDVGSLLPFVGSGFCDERHRAEVQSFFTPKVERAAGGPRNLAQALESIDLCIAQRKVQAPSVSAFLAGSERTGN